MRYIAVILMVCISLLIVRTPDMRASNIASHHSVPACCKHLKHSKTEDPSKKDANNCCGNEMCGNCIYCMTWVATQHSGFAFENIRWHTSVVPNTDNALVCNYNASCWHPPKSV